MRHRWGSKRLTYLSAAALFLWIGIVTFLISRSPDPGEPSPEALAAALEQAVSTSDTDAVKRLVANDPSPEAVERLLRAAECGSSIEVYQNHLLISSVGTVCASIPIADYDQRWFIDPWADLSPNN